MKKHVIIIFSICYISILLSYSIFKKNRNDQFEINQNLPKITKEIQINEVATLSKYQYNHASSIATLDNKLFVTWYSGSKETAPDTDIVLATAKKVNSKWQFSKPKIIMDRESYQSISKKYIHHLGNPSILSQGNRLWLFFTTSTGGWVTSSLNVIYSDNDGKTWSKPKIVLTSPVFNYSTLTRGASINLNNGNFGLPVYKEFNNLTGRWLIFDKNGQLIDISEMTTNGVTLQPTVVPISNTHALAFYREMRSNKKKIYFNESFDGGANWSEGSFTELNNPDAGIAAIKINNGILLAYNDSTENRQNLSLAYKSNDSEKWENIYTFENKEKYDLSYPFLITNNNNIFMTFSTGAPGKLKIKVVEIKGENINA
ncbi:exo-alpha-sialidase [Francisella frigiditurris]|uniref:BNR repeat-like domain protein n=1 Tax=Francisella frigiditurris TaxID=1542390 RepID=A0A1J0KTE3_9GAMM|nr:sialidase family protein [Francisella frigiditurris]APC97025.1 BNR repeat-like domain protein [Francisella frigiditurris]